MPIPDYKKDRDGLVLHPKSPICESALNHGFHQEFPDHFRRYFYIVG
jgi:hypothetical protein